MPTDPRQEQTRGSWLNPLHDLRPALVVPILAAIGNSPTCSNKVQPSSELVWTGALEVALVIKDQIDDRQLSLWQQLDDPAANWYQWLFNKHDRRREAGPMPALPV